MSLPGADDLVPQESEPSIGLRCWRIIIYEIARSNSQRDDIVGQRHACGEVAGSQRRNDWTGDGRANSRATEQSEPQ